MRLLLLRVDVLLGNQRGVVLGAENLTKRYFSRFSFIISLHKVGRSGIVYIYTKMKRCWEPLQTIHIVHFPILYEP